MNYRRFLAVWSTGGPDRCRGEIRPAPPARVGRDREPAAHAAAYRWLGLGFAKSPARNTLANTASSSVGVTHLHPPASSSARQLTSPEAPQRACIPLSVGV